MNENHNKPHKIDLEARKRDATIKEIGRRVFEELDRKNEPRTLDQLLDIYCNKKK